MKSVIAILAVVILVFLGYIFLSRKEPVDKAEAKIGNIHFVVAARGAVEAVQEANLAPKTLGRVEEIDVEEGDFVKKDDIIAVLENEEIKASIAQAKANLLKSQVELKEAEQSYIRTRAMYEKGIMSGADLDTSQMKHDVAIAQKKKAEADLQQARALLENTYVRAPFAGKITRRFLDPGETITLEKLSPIVTLSDVGDIIVRAEIDETDIRKVKIGQDAVITSEAYPGEEFKGKVKDISPAVGKKKLLSDNPADMVDRDVLETKIELDQSGGKLNLGLEVDVTIIVNDKKDVLIIPKRFVERRDGESLVGIKTEEGYAVREIIAGLSDDENLEILSGLEEGDIVVPPSEVERAKSYFPLNLFSR